MQIYATCIPAYLHTCIPANLQINNRSTHNHGPGTPAPYGPGVLKKPAPLGPGKVGSSPEIGNSKNYRFGDFAICLPMYIYTYRCCLYWLLLISTSY